MSWIDTTQYDPAELCSICHEPYGTTTAIYKTPCRHIFHNDCLYNYCKSTNGKIVCPVCRADVEEACMDVSAFKEKALYEPSELFSENQHVLDIYNNINKPLSNGGKRKKRVKKTKKRTGKNRRTTNKRRGKK